MKRTNENLNADREAMQEHVSKGLEKITRMINIMTQGIKQKEKKDLPRIARLMILNLDAVTSSHSYAKEGIDNTIEIILEKMTDFGYNNGMIRTLAQLMDKHLHDLSYVQAKHITLVMPFNEMYRTKYDLDDLMDMIKETLIDILVEGMEDDLKIL